MTTTELTTAAETNVIVGEAMMDAAEARQIVKNINRHFDAARRDLLELHDRQGWMALGYASWRDCVQEEFGQSAAYLYRQLAAARIELVIDSPIGDIPESHLRPLAQLDTPDQQRQAYQAATADGPATAKKVQQAVDQIKPPPELPIDFSIVQRRLTTHGIELTSQIQGQHRAYVIKKAGMTGVVMFDWQYVLDRLSLLEDGMDGDPDPAPAAPTRLACPTCGERILNGIWGDLKECGACYHARQRASMPTAAAAPAAPASGRQAYEASERADRDILAEAIATLAGARGLLSTVKVATWQRDKVQQQITPVEAKAFLLYQQDRLTRFSAAAMISQATFTQALDHIAALLDCVVME